jgi:MoaA/NifB/PqqE/SkfB family radical SAM enzyme
VFKHAGRALHACAGIDDIPALNMRGGEPTLDLTEFSIIVKWTTDLKRSFRLSVVTNGW